MKYLAPILLIISIAIALVEFTLPDGKRVYLVPDQVATLNTAIDCAPAAQTKIVMSGGTYVCVREPIDVVAQRLERAAGRSNP